MIEIPMRPVALLLLVLAGAVVQMARAPLAEAQGGAHPGPGGGRVGRLGRPSDSAESAPGAGQYSFDFDQVLEAVNRGEGHQALAYYERRAADAEQQGDRALAARAWAAAAAAALRLGLLQKTIQSGTQSIDLFKGAELRPGDPGRWISAYAQVGTAYRLAGNLAQARQVLEDGLGLAETDHGTVPCN